MATSNRRTVLSPEAKQDLIAIWHFGAQEWSPEQADSHLRHIQSTLDELRDNPNLGRSREDLLLKLRSIVVAPHLIFYRISPASIDVVRVLHSRLDTQVHFRLTKPENGGNLTQ